MSVFLRAISTLCLALTVGVVSCVIGTLLMLLIGWEKLPMDKGVPSLLAFSVGFLLVITLRRAIHSVGWIYQFFAVLGALVASGGFLLYIRGDALNDVHVPTGMFSGIGYALMMAVGIAILIQGGLCIAFGGFGYLARIAAERQSKHEAERALVSNR